MNYDILTVFGNPNGGGSGSFEDQHLSLWPGARYSAKISRRNNVINI